MHTYIHTYKDIHTYIHTYIHYINTYMHACIHTYTNNSYLASLHCFCLSVLGPHSMTLMLQQLILTPQMPTPPSQLQSTKTAKALTLEYRYPIHPPPHPHDYKKNKKGGHLLAAAQHRQQFSPSSYLGKGLSSVRAVTRVSIQAPRKGLALS